MPVEGTGAVPVVSAHFPSLCYATGIEDSQASSFRILIVDKDRMKSVGDFPRFESAFFLFLSLLRQLGCRRVSGLYHL